MSLKKEYNIPQVPAFSLKIEYAESYGTIPSCLSARNLRSEYAFYVAKEVHTPFLLGNTAYLLNAGDVLMVPPFELLVPIHRESVFRYYRILLPYPILHRLSSMLTARPGIRKNRFVVPENEKKTLFSLCERLLNGNSDATYLTVALLDLFSQTDGSYTESDEAMENYELCLPLTLKKVMLDIKNHYKTPLSLQGLAKANALSIGMLSRLFKEHLNLSPKQYWDFIRMQAASELLFCKETVKSVARTLTYCNASRFASAFKSTFGLSPSAYIKNGGYVQPPFL